MKPLPNSILFRIKVTGESLWPELVPGKTYWASRFKQPKPGRLVVCLNPDTPANFLIKKVQSIIGRQVYLTGTVSWSTNYHVDEDAILGTVL